jgi:hypothetical protein
VKRTEAGEEAPVRKEGEARIAPPVPAPRTAEQAGQVRKKLLAEPLEAAKKSAAAPALNATGARGESAVREYAFSAPPPGEAPGNMAKQSPPRADTQADVRLCGEVRDAANRPVAGARVAVTDLGRTTTTDAAGRFCVDVPRGEHPISVMAVGYSESRRSVRAPEGSSDLRVTLAAVPVLEQRGLTLAGRVKPGGAVSPPSELPGGAAVGPASGPTGEPRDAYSALSDTLRRWVREAQRLETDAAARRSAVHYDAAAGAWDRALRRLVDGPFEVETRRHLAETRYRAWETGPSSRRARAALQALTAYVSRAPAGPDRDRAAAWLDRVKP